MSDNKSTSSNTQDAHSAQSRSPLKQRLPISRKKLLIIGGVLLVLVAVGSFFLIGRERFSATFGKYTATDKDAHQIQDALSRAQDGKIDSAETAREAQDRALLYAALRQEADNRGIAYGMQEIDAYLKPAFQEYGGKEGYLKYMKETYSWSEEDVYQSRTVEFLKEKLAKHLLQNRIFTVVFFRWDNVDTFHPDNSEQVYQAKLKELETYRKLLANGITVAELEKRVDQHTNQTQIEAQKAYSRTKHVPISLIVEEPGKVTYVSDTGNQYDKGGDIRKEIFDQATKVGDVIGPKQTNDGRVVIARLDKIDQGTYDSWDAYLRELRAKAGLSTE